MKWVAWNNPWVEMPVLPVDTEPRAEKSLKQRKYTAAAADAAKALKLSKFQGFCCGLQPFRTPKLRIAIIWSMFAHRICIASIHFPLF